MKTNRFYIVPIILAVVSAACGVAQGSAATTASSEPALLLWEGPALFAEEWDGPKGTTTRMKIRNVKVHFDTPKKLFSGESTECHRLVVTQDYQALVGLCDGPQTEVEFTANQNGGLPDMIARFGPFQADTPQGGLIFNGHGEIVGPAWERAISSWAQFTQAELVSGHVGSANRTVLAWNLGEQSGQPNQCQILLVLAHGYATASLTPCEGGPMEVITNGWIDPTDWEQFDTWLYTNAPFYQGNNYLDGRGTVEISGPEAATLAKWTETVYNKLIQKE